MGAHSCFSFDSLPSEAGTVPSKILLYLRGVGRVVTSRCQSAHRCCSLAFSASSWACRLGVERGSGGQTHIWSDSSEGSDPSDAGMVPLMRLLWTYSVRRCLRFPSDAGRLPSKSLFHSSLP